MNKKTQVLGSYVAVTKFREFQMKKKQEKKNTSSYRKVIIAAKIHKWNSTYCTKNDNSRHVKLGEEAYPKAKDQKALP